MDENVKDEKKKSKQVDLDSTTKNFIKEVKRIRWPRAAKVWKWFGITIGFVVVMAIFCFLITLAFTGIWNLAGIKS